MPVKRRDWERDIELRQRNIVFPDTVHNEGRFYRNILERGKPVNPVQRAGLLILGFSCWGSTAFLVASLIRSPADRDDAPVITLIVTVALGILLFVLGLKLLRRGFSAPREKHRRKRKDLQHPGKY